MKTKLYYLPLISFLSVLFVYKSYYTVMRDEAQRSSAYHVISSATYDNGSNGELLSKLLILYENDAGFPREDEDITDDLINGDNFQWCPYGANVDEDVDCEELFLNKNKTAVERAKNWTSPCRFDDTTMANLSSDCAELKNAFPFVWPKSEENSDDSRYPLAYVLMVAKNAEQIVRLLQAIYRPWNLYCITYDNDTSLEFKQNVHNLNSCYDNVVIPNNFVDVHWGGFSILQSVMNCLTVLNGHRNRWRYVQVLSWNDFPLKTNAETVRIMQIFNGSQDSELSDGQPERFRQYHQEAQLDEKKKKLKKPLPPGDLIVYKGSMAATLSREFVHFTLTNYVARKFFEWSRTVWAPEEQFFSTLVHNLHTGVPGGFPGSCLPYYHFDKSSKPFVSRYQIWYENCAGQLTSGSCVFGVGDLHKLRDRRELVAHKLYLNFEPATFYCLSKLHHAKTFNKSYTKVRDYEFYKKLPAVRYRYASDKGSFQC